MTFFEGLEESPKNKTNQIIIKLCQIIKLNDPEEFYMKYKSVSIEIQTV